MFSKIERSAISTAGYNLYTGQRQIQTNLSLQVDTPPHSIQDLTYLFNVMKVTKSLFFINESYKLSSKKEMSYKVVKARDQENDYVSYTQHNTLRTTYYLFSSFSPSIYTIMPRHQQLSSRKKGYKAMHIDIIVRSITR